jgi:hypothetical protein
MGQEIGNRLDLEIIRLQIGDRAALGIGQMEEKQPQAIAVGTHRVGAGTTGTL